MNPQSSLARPLGEQGTTARSDRSSNLTMALQSQFAQPQATASLAEGAQVQLSLQLQFMPQAQVFLLGKQAQVWSQVQAFVWSTSVI